MQKYLLAAALCLPLYCQAGNMESAIGVGLQYGGLAGWQGSFTEENKHTRVAVGYLGVSIGYDYNTSPSSSIGGTLTFGPLSALTMNYNYYFNDNYNQGWRLGLDAGVGRVGGSGIVAGEIIPILFVSAGYAF